MMRRAKPSNNDTQTSCTAPVHLASSSREDKPLYPKSLNDSKSNNIRNTMSLRYLLNFTILILICFLTFVVLLNDALWKLTVSSSTKIIKPNSDIPVHLMEAMKRTFLQDKEAALSEQKTRYENYIKQQGAQLEALRRALQEKDRAPSEKQSQQDASSSTYLRANYSSLVANTTTPESESTITGCVVLYGTVNPIGVMAWMKFHEERWGLNRVEFHIRAPEYQHLTARISKAMEHARETNFISQNMQANFHSIPYFFESNADYEVTQVLSINKCLIAAQQRGSDFFLQMDPDEFLVSKEFQTLPEMFTHYGNRPAVVLPILNAHYDFCSSFKPTFDSVTYRLRLPIGAQLDPENPERLFRDVPRANAGNRKYVIRPQNFTFIKGVHDLVFSGEEEKIDDLAVHLNGRDYDGETTRIIHFRSGFGIQADEREFMCGWAPETSPEDCKYMDFGQGCSPRPKEGLSQIHEVTEVNRILAGVPLSEPAIQMYNQAVCYAQRYPDLMDGFCKGDVNNCNYKLLFDHYEQHGKSAGLVFNCTATMR